MKRIYLALGIYTTLFFAGTVALGLQLHATQGETWKFWHLRAGLFVAIFVCFVHSLVFIHLLGTGLGIKRAIEEHGLPEGARSDLDESRGALRPPAIPPAPSVEPTKAGPTESLARFARSDIYKFKMRAFPPAFVCMVLTIATAVAGGWVGGTPHLVLALVALAANVITFPWVVKQLGENEKVMRAVEAELAARTVAPRP